MTLGLHTPLAELHDDFVAHSTTSMPLAGTIYWTVVAVSSLLFDPVTVAYIVLIGSGTILPLGFLIDRLRGQHKMRGRFGENPLDMMFLKGTAVVVLLWPLVIIAAQMAGDPDLIVLGGAVLMALVWLPYAAAANDPVGLQHAVGRSIASYAAYLFVPAPYTATAIAGVVVLSYAYTVVRMKKGDGAA